MSFHRILIAVDGEPLAAHAADVGIELAVSLDAQVAFIYVVEPALERAHGIPPSELLADAEQYGRRLLAAFSQRMPQPSSALEFVPVGKPASEIVAAAKTWPADLVVIASHGRTGIRHALLGSVAEAVMHHAPCPILVIRAKE